MIVLKAAHGFSYQARLSLCTAADKGQYSSSTAAVQQQYSSSTAALQ
jgi:hypothetical protein